MKKKFFALMFVWAFALSGVAFAQTNQLVGNLPASDGAMTLNVSRLVNEALPQTLSGNQKMLGDILGGIDRLKEKTGVDLRQFETVAVGVASKKSAAGELDFAPVVLARGTFSAISFITLGKIAANSKYREERIGARTVYIFSPKQFLKSAPKSAKPAVKKGSAIERAIERMFDGLENELAVTAFDNNTLAIGTPARIRETLGTTPRIGGEVLDLISRKPNAVMNFGMKLPGGLSSFIKLDNDELGKNLDAIRFLGTSVDVSDGNALAAVIAKTATPEQAKGLQEILDTFQRFGKSFIGSTKINGKEIYARLIENARVGQSGNEVTLDVSIAQADLYTLIAGFAKLDSGALSPK